MSTMLKSLKTQFLDNYNVGVRRFAEMTGISRTRLEKFFSGEKVATEIEINNISAAMDYIVQHHEKAKEIKEKNKMKEEMNQTFKELLEATKQ
jgi:hypothetical protein